MNMEEQLREVVEKATLDSQKWHNIVHGDETSEIETENGLVPSIAKQLKKVRDEITGGAIDIVSRAENALDEVIIVEAKALKCEERVVSFRDEMEALKEETKTLNDLSQTTFDNISTATYEAISTIQSTTNIQIELIEDECKEQIIKASAQADRAEQVVSNKVDLNMENIKPTNLFVEKIIAYLCPDWRRKQAFELNKSITIIQKGWILMRNTVYTTTISGSINGHNVLNQAGAYGNWQEWNSLSFLVDVGDKVFLSGGELLFIPCKGI